MRAASISTCPRTPSTSSSSSGRTSRVAGEDLDDLRRGALRARAQLGRGEAADGMGNHHERIVRVAADLGLRLRTRHELIRADDRRRYAAPLQLDPVVQTARGAG